MLEGQARVLQERDGQRWPATDAGEPGTNGRAQREDVERAEVGEFAALEVAPDLLDGIQFRRVAGQSFDRQPRPLASEILSHHAALVPAEAVPDQDDLTAGEMALEGAQKADQGEIVVRAGPRLKVTAAPPAIPPEGQRGGDRQARPVAARVRQDRRVAARGPRAADDRSMRDPALVFEDDPRPPASRPACGRRPPAIGRARTTARPRIGALPTQQNPDGIRGWWMAFPSIAGYSMNPVNLFNETH